MVDICKDGEEGKADGSSDKNDKMDDEEKERENGEVDSLSGEESSSPAVVRPRPLPRRRNPNVLTSTDSSAPHHIPLAVLCLLQAWGGDISRRPDLICRRLR